MDNGNYIELLSSNICKQIAFELDRNVKPNWKSLISMMPRGFYNEKAILKFHMAVLQPNGSPTLQLLADLSRKRKTVGELILWLRSLERFPNLVDLLEQLELLPPCIATQPQSKTVKVGNNISLQFQVEGSPPFQHQWFKGDIQLNNQTGYALSLTNVKLEVSGYYICRVSNTFGYIFTDWLKLDITHAPSPESFNKPIFTRHPNSAYCKAGETLNLFTDAVGNPSPTFQWYYNDEYLEGECERQIVIPDVSPDLHRGIYYVKAINKHGEVNSMTADITIEENIDMTSDSVGGLQSSSSSLNVIKKESLCIKLSNPRGRDGNSPSHNVALPTPAVPTQKIALIIGNQHYVHANKLGMLHQPLNDAHDLASALISIDFKVVSLANLTLSAMNNALTYFYNLLDGGTYALFYFAGHGFESDNESYLVPIDATEYIIKECFPLSAVLVALTKRAMLSVLLVDSCRTNPGVCLEDPISKIWKNADTRSVSIEHQNVIIGYSCCSNGRAMESEVMRNGFFAKCLLEHITRNIKIDDVLFEVSKAMHKEHVVDPDTGKTQVVYRMSTVVEDLKLIDVCIPNSTTSEQTILWQQANIAPDSPVTILENEFISVRLIFTAEFSNSLRIQSSIIKLNSTFCDAMFILPDYIGTAPIEIVTPNPLEKGTSTKYARICNLERLQGDINIHLHITYDANGVLQHQTAFYCIKEKPLYAKIATKIAANMQ